MCQQLLSSNNICYYFQCYLEAGNSSKGNKREEQAKVVNHFVQHKSEKEKDQTAGRSSNYVLACGKEPIWWEMASIYRHKDIKDGSQGNPI